MPRNKRKHPHTRYERIMLACIDSLPFKFNSPGEPNIPGDEPEQRKEKEEKYHVTMRSGEQERTYKFSSKTMAQKHYEQMQKLKRDSHPAVSNRMTISKNFERTPTQSKRKPHRTPYRGEK